MKATKIFNEETEEKDSIEGKGNKEGMERRGERREHFRTHASLLLVCSFHL